MLEEYGEVEEISLKVGGWEGEDERGLDVRFAHVSLPGLLLFFFHSLRRDRS